MILLPPSLFLSLFFLGEKKGKFKSLVDTLKGLATFRTNYVIPDDVGVSYCLGSEIEFSKGLETIVVPFVAFQEGVVRIPMSRLLTNFLRHFKISPDQCCARKCRHPILYPLQLGHHSSMMTLL